MSPAIQHLYIHVPFCKGFCSYCPFYRERFSPASVKQWIAALEREMQMLSAVYPFALQTIYMGGGTPSVLTPENIARLSMALHANFPMRESLEWTIEANPESIDAAKVAAWHTAGATRVSLGVQSLENDTLQRMNRLHNEAMVQQAITILQTFPEISYGIDLIAGFPGVSDCAWQKTLEGVLAFCPAHISVYECTLHSHTALRMQISKGDISESSLETRNRALRVAAQRLKATGFKHYETSNFCQPGFRCQHNVAVWRGQDYVGLGPSASSRVGTKRWTSAPDLLAYVQAAPSGEFPRQTDDLTPEQDCTERCMFAFRLCDPVSLDEFMPVDPKLASRMRTHWESQLTALHKEGLVCKQKQGWCTTAKGKQMVDYIAESLLP